MTNPRRERYDVEQFETREQRPAVGAIVGGSRGTPAERKAIAKATMRADCITEVITKAELLRRRAVARAAPPVRRPVGQPARKVNRQTPGYSLSLATARALAARMRLKS